MWVPHNMHKIEALQGSGEGLKGPLRSRRQSNAMQDQGPQAQEGGSSAEDGGAAGGGAELQGAHTRETLPVYEH